MGKLMVCVVCCLVYANCNPHTAGFCTFKMEVEIVCSRSGGEKMRDRRIARKFQGPKCAQYVH